MATMRKKKAGGTPVWAIIRGLKEDAEEASYEANYYIGLGERNRALPHFERLKKLFARADSPQLAAEDARHTLQSVAAKARKEGLQAGRRVQAKRRRDRVIAKRGAGGRTVQQRIHLSSKYDD